MPRLDVSLRRSRVALELSQEALARAAGISRQAYAAIETGGATPSTEVALRLARALDTSVEGLFSLPDGPASVVEAELVSGPGPLGETQVRVQLHQVGDRWLARPLQGEPWGPSISHTLPTAQGLARGGDVDGSMGRRVAVDVWPKGQGRGAELVVAGCDPAMGVVAAYLQPQGVELVPLELGSRAALEQVARGQAHVAGCHLMDEATGQFNVPWVKRILPFPATVVTFAVWEQGLLVRPGNPKGVRGVADLARPGVSMVNREAGSGSRALLDAKLREAAVPVQEVAGYGVEARSHLVVAEVVAMGMADVGVGVKAAAVAAGLDFVSLGQERYDLVVPDHFLGLPAVQRLLAALRRRELRRQVEALGGYDTSVMGAEAPAA